MAEDILLKFEGADIKGESNIPNHVDEILIKSWGWAQSQTGTMHKGGGGSGGRVQVGDLTLTKDVDSASHALLKACSSGQRITKAILTQRKAGGTSGDYLKITMERVIVTSVQHVVSGEKVSENVSLNFGLVTFEYHRQDAGGKLGPALTYNWDIERNVAP